MRAIARAAAVLAAAATALLLATGSAGASTGTEHDPVSAPDATTASVLVTKLTHSDAASRLRSSGITWSSSGNCSDRSKPNCTSFDQVNLATIQGAQTLKSATGCALNVTGGTEVGHASGTYSHYNGYKLDFALSSCLTNYIKGTFTSIGGNKWRAGSGNVYYLESNH
ncbi:hypothetical protein [Actinokineospora globicatena]|uniref:hypothetical protein n=1 Tax=Actinokineospora globicatena TaxID=103729 RepID=UPI0020A3C039|nr:hypothetical protein [Actinokineospora globicatena]MCP2304720.1 hypothetical protein [Actinokineospora globicatena]GLW77904.1 hypothetical protein Aglo01_23860 [Actinokineospora globicatena]GLW85429.1 hypothetical protein Aglo02_30690 [Actinokineospora globicatena]